MSRNGFISDNLYDMRERLKRNHAEHNPAVSPAAAEEKPAAVEPPQPKNDPAPAVAVREAPPREKSAITKLPQLSFSSSNSDAARDGRDLEGRLLRDHSFAEAELELFQRNQLSLKNCRDAMEELLEELRALDADALSPDEYAGKVDALRREYFRLYGKLESFRAQSAGGSSSGHGGEIDIRYPSQWGIIAGIIGAAVIVSLTLVFIFG